jgi:hypothetical protein
MKLRSQPMTMVTALSACAGFFLMTRSASALMVLNSPFGNDPVAMYVGTIDNLGGQYVFWEDLNTNQCDTGTSVGVDALSDDLEIHGGPGNDYLIAVGGDTDGTTFCGWVWDAPITSGTYINLFGGDGDDQLWSQDNGDVWMYGEGGNDFFQSGNPAATIYGGDGDDQIYVSGQADTDNRCGYDIEGNAGNDCLVIDPNSLVIDVSCGGQSGDNWSGPQTQPQDCPLTNQGICE